MRNTPPCSLLVSVALLFFVGFQIAGAQAAVPQSSSNALQENNHQALGQEEIQVPDTMEQRLAACVQCHGEYGYGNANDPNIPRLAEKPAGYLYKQLLSFKAGEGRNAAMEYVVRQLSPEYLKTIAEYYAAQRVPFHVHVIPELSDAVMQRGEDLVNEGDSARGVPACKHCHGPALTGVKPMIPGILNQPYDYVASQLRLWRSNKRSTESTQCMLVVANRMRKSDIAAVAAWLAIQPLPENREPINIESLPQELPGWCVLEEGEVNL